MKSIGIACGPTGGHLFPATLVAGELANRGLHPVLFSRLPEGHRLLDDFDGRYVCLSITGWARQGPLQKAGCLVRGLRDFVRIRGTVGQLGGVIGFGGYSSIPVLLGAWEQGTPMFLHEQNRVLGRANRLFREHALRVFYGFPPVHELSSPGEVLVGNPIRRMAPTPEAWFNHTPLLVVFGGSQGSRDLSRHLRDAMPLLLDRGWRIFYVRGQFGLDLSGESRSRSVRFRQTDFVEALPAILAAADCAWVRAGAGTLTELMFYDLPGLIFPLRTAADQHQDRNASWLADRGPAEVVPEDVSVQGLVERTEALRRTHGGYRVPEALEGASPETAIVDHVMSFLSRPSPAG